MIIYVINKKDYRLEQEISKFRGSSSNNYSNEGLKAVLAGAILRSAFYGQVRAFPCTCLRACALSCFAQ